MYTVRVKMRSIYRHYTLLVILAVLFKICEGVRENIFGNFERDAQNALDAVELYIPTIYSENDRCRNHSLFYLEQLRELKLWATEMFDATTKFPSGLLYGSTYDLGNFDECLEVKAAYGKEDFRGKYCLARLAIHPSASYEAADQRIDWENDDYKRYFNVSVSQKIKEYANSISRTNRNDYHVSFCLPSSCSHSDLQHSLETIIISLTLESFNVTVDIDKEDCQTEDTQYRFSRGDLIFGCVCGLYVMFILTASVWYKIASTSNSYNEAKLLKLFKCLAVGENTKKLLGVKKRHEDGLDGIGGMKVVSMFLIILGHRCMFTFGSPLKNPKFIEQMYLRAEASVLLNGTIVVDSFFIIAGFLATYLLLDRFSRTKASINIPLLYLHRFLRIIPPYGVVLAFYSTLFSKIGSGPFWQKRVGLEQERCSSNWWLNLLFVNNYVNRDNICMFQSWFLDCDVHYFLATPFLAWLLIKKPRLGLFAVASLIATSLTTSFIIVFLNNYDAILLLYMRLLRDPVLNDTFKNIYIPSHMRASPYLLGILVGFVKHKMKSTGHKLSSGVVHCGWIISVFLMLTTVYSGFVFYQPYEFSSGIFAAFYSSIHHLTWSLAIGWMIIAVTEGHGGIIRPFLAWKPFVFLGRITYSAFLVHGAVQIYSVAIIRSPIYANIFDVVYQTMGDIIGAYFLGFFLSLFFESPVVQLEKFLLFREGKTEEPSCEIQKEKRSETYHERYTSISLPKY